MAKPHFRISIYWLYLFLFVAGMLYLFPHINYGLDPIDEGFNDYQAFRVLSGQIPYKDFFDIYPPGQLYLDALILKLFNSNMMYLRWVSVISGSAFPLLCLILVFKITRNISSSLVVWVLCLLYGLSLSLLMPVYTLNAMLLGGISFWYFLRFNTGKSRWDAFLLGIFLSLAFLFKQTIGEYYILAYMVMAMIYWHQKWLSHKEIQQLIVCSVLSFLLVTGVFLFFLYLQGALQGFVREVIIYPFIVLKTQPDWLNPTPKLSDLKNISLALNTWSILPWLYFFQLATLITGFVLVLIGYVRHKTNQWLATILILAACTFLLDHERFSLLKTTTTLPYSIILSCLICHELYAYLKSIQYKLIAGFILGLFLIACSVTGVRLYQTAFSRDYYSTVNPVSPHVYIPLTEADKYTRLNLILEKLHAKGQYVFVYPYTPMFYIMFHIQNPTAYDIMDLMGVLKQETAIIQSLQEKKVKFLVYDNCYNIEPQAFEKIFPLVNSYINLHYHVIDSPSPCTKVWELKTISRNYESAI